MVLSTGQTPYNKHRTTALKISQIIENPSIRIILYLNQKGQARHADLGKLITSRGTLSISLKDLENEEIIQRKILDTKPIQSIYSLTEKGKNIAQPLKEIEQLTK